MTAVAARDRARIDRIAIGSIRRIMPSSHANLRGAGSYNFV